MKKEISLPQRKSKLSFFVVATVTLLVLASIFAYFYLSGSALPKAAIIDQLSSSTLNDPPSRYVNTTFIETAKNLLYERFSSVDYYSENATIENYKRLASLGYKLIIWRAHSALHNETGNQHIAICSSDYYYGQDYEPTVTLCNIAGDPRLYIAITASFIKEVMHGSFTDTVIVFMSCNGLKEGYTKTAQVFVEKGAKAFVSWTGWIGSADNDDAITMFLSYLIYGNNSISQAVSKIPMYNSTLFGSSRLSYYPAEAADYHIPDYRQTRTGASSFLAVKAFSKKKFLLRRSFR
ncbi:MAG: hypothetical protein QW840_04140 [Candidatus Bathyarchaeia archaeon]